MTAFVGFTKRKVFGRALYPNKFMGQVSGFPDGSFDEFAAFYSGWSVSRLVNPLWTGPLIEVRRSSDNALQNIFPDQSGNLNLQQLFTFIGASSGLVRTVYDQSQQGRHLIQTTLANQPRIINAGTLETQNGKPTLFFDGTNDSLSVLASTTMYNFMHQASATFTHSFGVFRVGTGAAIPTNVLYGLVGTSSALATTRGLFFSYDNRVTSGRTNALLTIIYRGVSATFNLFSSLNNKITQNQLFQVQLATTADTIFEPTPANRCRARIDLDAAEFGNLETDPQTTGSASHNFTVGALQGGAAQFMLGYWCELFLFQNPNQVYLEEFSQNQKDFYGIT
jgi:hypothetical protein